MIEVMEPVRRPVIRTVSPPIYVAIDVAALLGRTPHFVQPPEVPTIAPLAQVVGHLDAWVLSSSGWLGACEYRLLLYGTSYLPQSHLVPAWALRLAAEAEIAEARRRSEIRW
jgi:hypothetical protein